MGREAGSGRGLLWGACLHPAAVLWTHLPFNWCINTGWMPCMRPCHHSLTRRSAWPAYTAAGVYDSVQGAAIYKSTANSSAIILTPSTVLYVAEHKTSSASLSPGAVAGICVAASALVAAAAALLIQRVRRQRQRRHAQLDEGKPAAASCSSSTPATSRYSQPASQPGSADAVPATSVAPAAVSGAPQQPGLPPHASRPDPAAAAVSCRAMSHRTINAAPPVAPSPFAAASMHAFATPVTAVASPAAATSVPAATPRLGSTPLRQASAAEGDAPMPELMQMIEQQDLLQESMHSEQLDVGTQLAALPSNLPQELSSWVIDPADIKLQTWPNGSLKELGSGAR